ncbi:hypothetical protein [Nocardioides lianchengensis]|uniref:Asp23 family, cell envelope-related function n=1 Tax=Nocardioides lianchengensis TaxID=1045774 RepID=A0A1G6S7U3_9ACTN|nr:hypothetical protein [Nocardioides lianchengensis]NYG09743.1 putative alkaline shock family protein YloU [Nocardioides lianchengensis]SDD12899.1 hypothetical protein SAMN05421872_10652 [Nocardioides lianchengensis]
MAEPETADELTEAGLRGHLDLRLAAITRIVEHVVTSADGTQARTSALGSTLGRVAGRTLPRVDVRVSGRTVRIRAEVGCPWPEPAGPLGERVRDAVVAETERLTGLRVRAADIVVHVLPAAEDGAGAQSRRVA